jgi:hypothetical protein
MPLYECIIDFVSSSPVRMSKCAIMNPSLGQHKILRLFCFFHLSFINLYQLILSWIPTADRYGPQGFSLLIQLQHYLYQCYGKFTDVLLV